MATVTPLVRSPDESPCDIVRVRYTISTLSREIHLLSLALDGLEGTGDTSDLDLPALQFQVMRLDKLVDELRAAAAPQDETHG